MRARGKGAWWRILGSWEGLGERRKRVVKVVEEKLEWRMVGGGRGGLEFLDIPFC